MYDIDFNFMSHAFFRDVTTIQGRPLKHGFRFRFRFIHLVAKKQGSVGNHPLKQIA